MILFTMQNTWITLLHLMIIRQVSHIPQANRSQVFPSWPTPVWIKTKVQNTVTSPPSNILMHGQKVEALQQINSLGSQINSIQTSRSELAHRIGIAART